MNSEKWDDLNSTFTKEFKKQLEFGDIVNDFIKKFPKNFNSFIGGNQTVIVSNTVEMIEPYSVGIKLLFNFKIFFDKHHPDDIDNKDIKYKTKIVFIKKDDGISIKTKNDFFKYKNNNPDITKVSEHIYNEILKNSINIVSENL